MRADLRSDRGCGERFRTWAGKAWPAARGRGPGEPGTHARGAGARPEGSRDADARKFGPEGRFADARGPAFSAWLGPANGTAAGLGDRRCVSGSAYALGLPCSGEPERLGLQCRGTHFGRGRGRTPEGRSARPEGREHARGLGPGAAPQTEGSNAANLQRSEPPEGRPGAVFKALTPGSLPLPRGWGPDGKCRRTRRGAAAPGMPTRWASLFRETGKARPGFGGKARRNPGRIPEGLETPRPGQPPQRTAARGRPGRSPNRLQNAGADFPAPGLSESATPCPESAAASSRPPSASARSAQGKKAHETILFRAPA